MNNKYIKNTLIVFIIIILGKLLSFLRDILISQNFGSSLQTDAYFVAGNVPSIIFTAILSSYLVLVIPTYKFIKINQGKEQVNIFTSRLINYFIIVSILLSIIGYILANQIIHVIAPGFNQHTHNLSVHICQILILSFPLSSVTLILANISNANEKYYSLHLIPIISSIFVIIPLILYSKNWDIYLVAISSVVAFIFQLFVQIIISRNEFKYKFKSNPFDDNIKNMSLLMLPLFVSYSIDQLNVIITSSMCTYLPIGSLSSYNYAIRLQTVINGSISISIISIIYPLLSRYFAENKIDELNKTLSKSINASITIVTPIIIILSFFSKEIVTLVFFRGNFDLIALNNTSIAFKYSIINVLMITIRDILLRAFYIFKNTKVPLYSSLTSLFFNIILSLLLLNKYKLEGIVIANLISSFLSLSTIILFSSKLNTTKLELKFSHSNLVKIFIAALILLIFLNALQGIHIHFSIYKLVIYMLIALFIYCTSLVLLKQNEGVIVYNYLKKIVHAKF